MSTLNLKLPSLSNSKSLVSLAQSSPNRLFKAVLDYSSDVTERNRSRVHWSCRMIQVMYYCLNKIWDTSPGPRVIPLSPPSNLGPHQGPKHDAGSPELEHHAQGVSLI
jgi:hypothetical protein